MKRFFSVILILAMVCSLALPAVSAAGGAGEDLLLDALEAGVAPTNKILADRLYNPTPIAQISFDRESLTLDLMMLDTEKLLIKMLEVPFLRELFSYEDIYALQIGDSEEDYVDHERLNQFNIMLAAVHSTIGAGMDLEECYLWLCGMAETLTIGAMDGHSTDVTIICRTDREDESTEYSLTLKLRLYNRYHKITWRFNNGEEDYVREKVAYGSVITKPNPTAPEGMKFCRWEPEVPAVMGTTDLEFSAVWIPADHAGYVVRHYLQSLTLDSYDLAETEYLSDKIGTSILGSDAAKEFTGFKLNNVLGDAGKTSEVTENGAMRLNLYYDRINIKINWEFFGGAKKLNRNVKYGLMPEPPEAPAPPDDGRDYVFVRWDREITPATEPTTYKARYADDKVFVVTLDANGGEVAGTEAYLYIGDSFTLLPTPTREGYRFDGWFFEDGTPVDPTVVIEDEGAATAVAHWTVRQYTITFDPKGGVWPDGSNEAYVLTLDFGAVIVPPEDPVKEGCVFRGWNPLLPYTMPAKTLCLTARWHVHELVADFGVAPTCTTPGRTEGEHCLICDYTTVEEIPALGHDYVDGVCTRCGEADPNASPTVVLGDVDGSGEVDAVDAIRLAKYLVELVELTDAQKQAADVTGNGDVTTTDAIRLAKYLVGMIETLETEPTKAAPRAAPPAQRSR